MGIAYQRHIQFHIDMYDLSEGKSSYVVCTNDSAISRHKRIQRSRINVGDVTLSAFSNTHSLSFNCVLLNASFVRGAYSRDSITKTLDNGSKQ